MRPGLFKGTKESHRRLQEKKAEATQKMKPKPLKVSRPVCRQTLSVKHQSPEKMSIRDMPIGLYIYVECGRFLFNFVDTWF